VDKEEEKKEKPTKKEKPIKEEKPAKKEGTNPNLLPIF
jgi:hypothetical protein